MELKDLKSGDIVETREGSRYIVLKDVNKLQGLDNWSGWLTLSDYSENFKDCDCINYDIVKVSSSKLSEVLHSNHSVEWINVDVVKTKELTIDEVEKLYYKNTGEKVNIKIIKE